MSLAFLPKSMREQRALALVLGLLATAVLGSIPLRWEEEGEERTETKADQSGIPVSPWICLGPLDNPLVEDVCEGFQRDFLEDSGGEAVARPIHGQAMRGLKWRRPLAPADGSEVDFIAQYGNVNRSVAYAFRTIETVAGGDYVFKIGSDDGIKVWLNGRLIHANHSHRALSRGEDLIIAPMEPGSNALMVKVDQGDGSWGFSLEAIPLAGSNLPRRKPAALKVVSSSWVIQPGESVLVSAMAYPADSAEGPVDIELSSPSGAIVLRAPAKASRPLEVRIPKDVETGAYILQARGAGAWAGAVSDAEPLIIGQAALIFKEAAASARATLARSPESPWYDRAASLEFLADLLDGRCHPSLAGMERKLSALIVLKRLMATSPEVGAMPSGALRLAYRSVLDGSLQPYSLYVPPGLKPEASYPLLVFLHGMSGDDWGALEPFAKTGVPGFIVLAPFGRGDLGYQGMGESDVLEAMDAVMGRYLVDPDRVSIAGSSMGGYGALRLAQLYTDRFAGVAAFAGWSGSQLLSNLRSLPTLIVHGEDDPQIPSSLARGLLASLKDSGFPVSASFLPGAGHSAFSAWTASAGAGRLLDWLRHLKRDSWPAKLSLSLSRLRYGSHYWVRVLDLEEGQDTAYLDASIDDNRHLSVQTSGVAAFSVDLRHPGLAQSGRVVLWADGAALAMDAGRVVSLRKGKNGAYQAYEPPEGVPVNLGGSFADLMAKPLFIVYGTKAKSDRRAALELQARMALDITANETMSGARSGSPRVLSDKEYLSLGSIDASALFVGSPAENLALAPLAAELPGSRIGSAIHCAGRVFPKSGILLVCAYPGRPSQLLGLIDLPQSGSVPEESLRRLGINLRSYAGFDEDPSGEVLPDIVVIGPRGEISYVAYFDAHYKMLRANK